MTAHSRLSPSGSHRWLQCPASARDFPDTGDAGEAAERGTKLHELAAYCLRGSEVFFESEDDRYIVNQYVKFVQELRSVGDPFHIEQTFRSDFIPEMFGTIDACLVIGNRLHVVDLKTGRTPVDAHNNTQLMAYLCLAHDKYPHTTEFYGTIVQPIVGGVTTAEYTLAELTDFLLAASAAAYETDVYRAGSHCQYCPLLPTCGTAREHNLKVLSMLDTDPSLEESIQILEWEKPFAALVRQVKSALQQRLMRGEKVPGYRLGQSLGNRAWANEQALIHELLDAGVQEDQYLEKKLKSPAQLEKIVSKSFVERHAVRPKGAVTLVANDSKTPCYNPLDAFDD